MSTASPLLGHLSLVRAELDRRYDHAADSNKACHHSQVIRGSFAGSRQSP